MNICGVQHVAVRVALGLAVSATFGCGAVPLAQDEAVVLPYPAVQGRPRSIVFNSQKLRTLSKVAESTDSPWYASRNDARLTTFAGYRSATTDQLVNIIYDRQAISGGRSQDQYHNVTYRQTVSQTVR